MINFYLEELLKNADSKLILITPYLQLQPRIRDLLDEKKRNGVRIDIALRLDDLKEDLTNYATHVFDIDTLHAKCYISEHAAILTSMNLYEFSQKNNVEMGIYVENEGAGKVLYAEILTEANRLCKYSRKKLDHQPIDRTATRKTSDSMGVVKGLFKCPFEIGKNYQNKIVNEILGCSSATQAEYGKSLIQRL